MLNHSIAANPSPPIGWAQTDVRFSAGGRAGDY
jgi:hypothetical protein